eukprot:GHVQ01006923.1.p1 GENE.GHVQ01006923.1~~GHVQ01006923.1.p1  ORF type:complete len:415 (+),score=59.44 GHVQ01006923.1:296-1540(+)
METSDTSSKQTAMLLLPPNTATLHPTGAPLTPTPSVSNTLHYPSTQPHTHTPAYSPLPEEGEELDADMHNEEVSCVEDESVDDLSMTRGGLPPELIAVYNPVPVPATGSLEYCVELVTHLVDKNAGSVRAVQARLTLFEALEHFDFFNDLFFICRVVFSVFVGKAVHDNRMGLFALWWLGTIWLTSFLGYVLRPCLIYHRISGDDMKMFMPFLVFQQIRVAGQYSPQTLYMYERLYWTYALIMRVVEDTPQVIASSIFLLSYGRDAYAIAVILVSFILLIITSIRMGRAYPLAGTVSLLLSTQPPVDSPVVSEATHTSYHITLYMAATCLLWTATHIVTLQYVMAPFTIVVICMLVMTGAATIGFLILWFYYSMQSEIDVDQRFMRGTSQLYPRFDTSMYSDYVPDNPEMAPTA